MRFMHHNFSTKIEFEGKSLLAVILPSFRSNGMHYEVNIAGFPRFWLRWGSADRFDLARTDNNEIPEGLVLAVGDAIEHRMEH